MYALPSPGYPHVDHCRKVSRGGRFRDGTQTITYSGSKYRPLKKLWVEHGEMAVVRVSEIENKPDERGGAPQFLFVYSKDTKGNWEQTLWVEQRPTRRPRAAKAVW